MTVSRWMLICKIQATPATVDGVIVVVIAQTCLLVPMLCVISLIILQNDFSRKWRTKNNWKKIQNDGTKNRRGEWQCRECNKCIRVEVEKCTTEIYVFLMFFLSFFHTHHACPESFPDRWLAFHRYLREKNPIRNECSKLKSGNEKLYARNIESQS